MKIADKIGTMALSIAALAIFLYFVEVQFVADSEDWLLTGLAVLSVAYFSYATLALFVFRSLCVKANKSLTGFYLANNLVRLFLAIILIVTYGLTVREGILLFALNLLPFYGLVAASLSSICTKLDKNFRNQ